MENQSTLKVELKNQSGIWVEVCDPAERGSYTWDDCDLAPFEHILKEVGKVELRMVSIKSGACHQYLKCAKLDIDAFKCDAPEPFCGDGIKNQLILLYICRILPFEYVTGFFIEKTPQIIKGNRQSSNYYAY